jgi:hypothetical protein
MYKISIIGVHNPILLITPFCLEIPIPVPVLPFYLLGIPPLHRGATPVHSDPWLAVNWPPPPPFAPHSLFPFPQWFPISNTCPPTTTLRYRLHIVWYSSTSVFIAARTLLVTNIMAIAKTIMAYNFKRARLQIDRHRLGCRDNRCHRIVEAGVRRCRRRQKWRRRRRWKRRLVGWSFSH